MFIAIYILVKQHDYQIQLIELDIKLSANLIHEQGNMYHPSA